MGDIIKELQKLDEAEIITLWNTYCEGIKYYDDMVYSMNVLDDFLYDLTPTEVIKALSYSDFCINDEYFYNTVWGVMSTDDIYDKVDLEELAEWLVDNPNVLDDRFNVYHELYTAVLNNVKGGE